MIDLLEMYRNYLYSLDYRKRYGDRYGDTDELISLYERKLGMKEPYIWDYSIRVKTKEGTFEYEKDNVLEAVKVVEQHPDYEEFYMKQNKLKCDKCKIELSEVFIQETPQRTYRLCKKCNNYYMKLMENVKKLEKIRGMDNVGNKDRRC